MAYLINTQSLRVFFHKLNGDKISTSSQILHFDIVKYLTSYGQPTGFCHNTLMPCRAAKNGRSIDQVRSELDIDRTNPWIAGHHVRSFTYSFTEISLFDNQEGQHLFPKGKDTKCKTKQISGREIPGTRKFS